MPQNNAAGRLHRILARAREFEKKRGNQCWEVLPDLFGIPKSRPDRMFHCVSRMVALPAVVESAMKRQENIDASLYLTWVPNVVQAFTIQNFQEQYARIYDRIDSNVLSLVRICDDMLSRNETEPLADEKQLGNLAAEAIQMMELVNDAGLPEELRRFIIRQLETVIRSIDDYMFLGADALRSGFESTLGAIVVNRGKFEEIKRTEVGGRFWDLLARYALITSVMINTQVIGGDYLHLLPSPNTDTTQPTNSEEGASGVSGGGTNKP